jgi:hypothetical protein
MPAYDGAMIVSAVGRQYETVLANQVAQPLGENGAAGDTLDQLWIMPTTLGPGAVVVLDEGVPVWTWPAGIVPASLAPIFIPLNLRSVNGAWQITTGANLSVLASGAFTVVPL